VLSEAANANGLRDMQGLAARFSGGRSEAEPGVARTKADERFRLPTAPKKIMKYERHQLIIQK